MEQETKYTEDNIRSLDWKEHIRMRPGMYIGKLGDGSSPDDGIYVLLKEVVDNSIDEYIMGHGKKIEIKVSNNKAVLFSKLISLVLSLVISPNLIAVM